MPDSLRELTREIRDFVEERDWQQFHSPKNLAMALVVEAGELMEHFQWLSQERSLDLDPETRAAVAEEVGDVLIYLCRLCDRLGIDPVDAARRKMAHNRDRYPLERARVMTRRLLGRCNRP